MATFAVDTNVWLRTVDLASPQRPQAMEAIELLESRGDKIVLAPQNLYEIWVVITRPRSVNGLGMSSVDARNRLDILQDLFSLLPETPEVFVQWLDLVSTHIVTGKPAHDARLIAWMQVHALEKLISFNIGDFKRYGLEVLHRQDVIQSQKDEP